MDQPIIVGIRFQKSGKVYHFDASHCSDIRAGDYAVVETARGRQLGEVIRIITSEKNPEGNIKPIHRKANPRDLVLRQIWQCKEKDAVLNCRMKANELGLTDLRIISAEFSYDGRRLNLMYNSEEGSEKPDLRNLRRAMSRFYPHAQVEMHPMGPRDVAKYLGGMGACGLEERCCTAYLTDFSPISIKMAKEQGISLTPTEITGICGRLRCCLAYEFDQYLEARKSLPKKNKRVFTPNGEGKVIEVYPLKATVLVLLDTNVMHEFPANEVQDFNDGSIHLVNAVKTLTQSNEEGDITHTEDTENLRVSDINNTSSQENEYYKRDQSYKNNQQTSAPNQENSHRLKKNKNHKQHKQERQNFNSSKIKQVDSQQNVKKSNTNPAVATHIDTGKSHTHKRRNRGRPKNYS